MKNPNEISSAILEEEPLEEGTSWTNPGEFPAFMSGIEHNINANPHLVAKEAQIEEIKSANQGVEETLVAEYVQSDLFDRLSDKNLDITAIKPVQEQLCAIPEQSRELFLSIVSKFDRNDNWKPHFQVVLNNFTNGKFDDLIRSASKNVHDRIDLAAFDRIITHKDNYLSISNINELNNIEGIIDEKINKAAQNRDAKQWENFALLKKYNLSLDEAKILVEKYAYKIEDVDVEEYSDSKRFLTELKSIVSAKTPEEFGGLLDSASNIPVQNYPDFQINAQRMYAESFNHDLFNPKELERYVEDDAQIIDAGTDFRMIVRSEGAFSDRKQDDNHADRWNRPLRTNTAFSTSLISNSHLLYYGMTQASESAPSVTYGFSELDDDAIVENAMGDDATIHRRKLTLDTSSYGDFRDISPTTFDGCGQRFMPFDSIMNDSSRGIHTETVLSRFYLDENGNERRRQPSYIVYVKMGENYHEDPLYKESKKTARDFDVPVVIIDMKKVLNEERRKVEQRRAELEQDWNIDGVVDIVQSWANNSIIQLRSGASELVNEFFPEEIDGKNVMAEFISTQMEKASNDERQELFDKLMVLNAKKRIVSDVFMVHLQHNFPHLLAKLNKYGEEIFGITVNSQSPDSIWYSYKRADECYDVCEKNNLNITDDMLTKRSPDELRKSISVCIEAELKPSEELVLIRPYDLERSIDICQTNELQLDSGLLTQNPHILERKIMACKNSGIQLSSDILNKTEQEIDVIVKENRKVTTIDRSDGFDDFSADEWGDNSWDDWA